MKNPFARWGIVVVALLSVATAQAALRRSKASYPRTDMRKAAIAALSPGGPGGKDTFLVVARDGVIEVGLEGGRVNRKIIRDARRIHFFRACAEKLNRPQLVLNEPVNHVAHRLDTVRFLNDTVWTAMNLLVSLRLDSALAQGRYKFVIFSDARSYVLLRQGARTGRSGRGYSGIKIVMGKRTDAVNQLLSHLGYDRKDGVTLEVAELPPPSTHGMTAQSLMLRVMNKRIGDSPVLERLIAVQRTG